MKKLISLGVLIVALCVASSAFCATEVIRYVDPNADAGGDGTTNALTSIDNTHAYVSLAVWEAAMQDNLVASDTISKVICSSDDAGSTHLEDTDTCTINGWTTSATNRIIVEQATITGKYSETSYRMHGDAAWSFVIGEENVTVRGIQFYTSVNANDGLTGVNLWSGMASGTWNIIFERCIFRATGRTTGGGIGIYFYKGTVAANNRWCVRNCLFVGFAKTQAGGYGTGINDNSNDTSNASYTGIGYYFNNTFIVCDYGLWVNDGYETAYFTSNGLDNITVASSYKNDANATLNNAGNLDDSSGTPSYIDAANGDYHQTSGSAWVNYDATGFSEHAVFPFSNDIDGQSRPNGTWDVGMDEYHSTGGRHRIRRIIN